MKSKLLLTALPLLFLACESEDAEATIIGSWILTNYEEYSGPHCPGTPDYNMDSVTAGLGDNYTWTFEFTEEKVTNSMNITLSAEDMCSMWGGTLSGDSCSVEWFGNAIIMPIDTMCFDFGGVLSDGNCSVTETNTSDYSIDEDVITITEYADTDSVETLTGTWSIENDILSITVSDDSSCTNLTLTK